MPTAPDFYCDEVLSGRTAVNTVVETDDVLAFYHTRPYWAVHIVVIPRRHIGSLLDLKSEDDPLLLKLIAVVKAVAAQVVAEHSGCRIVTNLGVHQDSQHLHWHIGAGEPL
ncbi:MAG: HIT family hydrolase [Dehalococcoidia bacterium]|nr:HIT family hydrolase [Dehalococcoidia bacterium]